MGGGHGGARGDGLKAALSCRGPEPLPLDRCGRHAGRVGLNFVRRGGTVGGAEAPQPGRPGAGGRVGTGRA